MAQGDRDPFAYVEEGLAAQRATGWKDLAALNCDYEKPIEEAVASSVALRWRRVRLW